MFPNKHLTTSIETKHGKKVEDKLYEYNADKLPTKVTTKTIFGTTNAPSVVTTAYANNMGFGVKTGAMLSGTEHIDTYEYDYVGNATQYRSALDASKSLAYTTKYEYDYAGRVTKETNALNQSVSIAYDALGRSVSVTDYAGSATTHTYDNLGRVIKTETPFEGVNKAVTKTYYDAAGNVTREQAQNNAQGAAVKWTRTDYAYNNRNMVTAAEAYNGSAIAGKTAYTYDAAGNVLTVTNGTAAPYAVTTYTYDKFGNVLTAKDALNQTESYTYAYGGAGQVLTKTDRNGIILTYAYDGLGRRLTTKNGAAVLETNTYTRTGAAYTESNGALTTTYKYDGLGRATQVSESGGSVVKTYSYDVGGNRTGYTLRTGGASGPVQQQLSYTYDNLSRLLTVSEGGAVRATYAYDTNGNRASVAYGNSVKVWYTYNLANLVKTVTNRNGTATNSPVISSYSYVYRLDGNQASKTDHTGKVTAYTYDGLGRLTGESEPGAAITYAYDSRGNRTGMTKSGVTTAYTYDLNNRLTQTSETVGTTATTVKYTYDKNGNTIAKMTEVAGNSTNTPASGSLSGDYAEYYAYDSFNRMVYSLTNGVETSYEYRPDGLRHGKTAGGTVTMHLWDGANIVGEMANGTVTATYIRGVGLIASQKSGVYAYYLFNGHGDVVQHGSKTYDYDASATKRPLTRTI